MKKRKRKRDDDIIVSCIGESTNQVTGSCWSISYVDDNYERQLLMIECGLPQSNCSVKEAYTNMKRSVNTIKGGGYIETCKNLIFLHGH